MSHAHDLLDALELAEIARQAGVTYQQARLVAAMLGELPAAQAARLIGTAARQVRVGRENAERKADYRPGH